MQKPLLLVETEFQEELMQLVNKYLQLCPARYLRIDVDELQRQLLDIEERQLVKVKKEYTESLKERDVSEEVKDNG